jgi:hypothetical protein
MTFLGSAPSQHLAYGASKYRELPFITNNHAGSMIAYPNLKDSSLDLYVTNETFARAKNSNVLFRKAQGVVHTGEFAI